MNKGPIITPKKGFISGNITPILTVALFAILIGISVFSLMNKSKANTVALMDNDLHMFVDIFKKIHTECKILNFDYQLNVINFLNVKSFAGSEVGSINLAYPEKWQGPYLTDNPTVQGQEYLVVVTHKGCFVTPGTGVRLPSGHVIGTDIILGQDADIQEMMKEGGVLNYKGTPLAAKLDVGASVFERVMRDHLLTLDDE
jgi:hypothetical protein